MLVDFPGAPYAVRAVACLVHTHPNPVVVARLFAAQNLCGGLANMIQPTVNRWRNGETAPVTDGAAGALGDEGVLSPNPPNAIRDMAGARPRPAMTWQQSRLVDLLRPTVSVRSV